MVALSLVLLFILGLCLGSFAGVLIQRLPKEQSWIFTRSACPRCNKSLQWADLVPLISFALLKGKCRYCQKPISWQYPLLELGMGLSFVGIGFWMWPVGFLTTSWLLALIFIGITLAIIDLKHYLLPDKLVYTGIIVTFTYIVSGIVSRFFISRAQLLSDKSGFGKALIDSGLLNNKLNAEISALAWTIVGATLVSLFFYLLILITRGRGMGMGDVKLAFLIGLVTNWPRVLSGLFLAFLSGALVAVMLIIFRKRSFGQTIPFGPFLILGAGASLIYGDQLLKLFGY